MESGGEEAVWPPGKGPCSALSFLCSVPVLVGFFFFCFFVLGCPCMWKFPDQGSNWSCNCRHSNTGSLTRNLLAPSRIC